MILRRGYDTSYRALSRKAQKADNWLNRFVRRGSVGRRIGLFGLFQLAFTLVTLLLAVATFHSPALAAAWQVGQTASSHIKYSSHPTHPPSPHPLSRHTPSPRPGSASSSSSLCTTARSSRRSRGRGGRCDAARGRWRGAAWPPRSSWTFSTTGARTEAKAAEGQRGTRPSSSLKSQGKQPSRPR